MKKRLFAILPAVCLLLSGCGRPTEAPTDTTLSVVATTYPIYLFTTAVTHGVADVEVSLLVNQETSCLHDYTLTVPDMKLLEQADVIVQNGVGLEDFLTDALTTSTAALIDCSRGVSLLPAHGHEGHDHETEYDPHIWMDPSRAAQMVTNISVGLSLSDPDNTAAYEENAAAAVAALTGEASFLKKLSAGDAPLCRELITFHDGFSYFADALDLHLLHAMEEEEGSEASAAEIREILALIEEHDVPAIFTEVNGSNATAAAIARESGVTVGQLSMVMSGDGSGLDPYCAALRENGETVIRLLRGKQASEP